jgi:hypothetical protein
MLLPDGKPLMHGTSLYDPKKAHEYYLRTRKLKGRKKGRGEDPAAKKAPSAKGHEVANFLNKLPMAGAGASTQEIADFVKDAVKKSDDELRQDQANYLKTNTVLDHAKANTIDVLIKNRASKGKQTPTPDPNKPRPAAKFAKATPQAKQAAARRVASIRSELADLQKKLKDAEAEARKADAKEKRGPTRAEKSKAAKEAKKYRDKNKQKLANKRKAAASKSKASGKPKADTVSSLKNKIAEVKGRLDKAIQAQKALGK